MNQIIVSRFRQTIASPQFLKKLWAWLRTYLILLEISWTRSKIQRAKERHTFQLKNSTLNKLKPK